MSLLDKVAIVTGAGSGIGAATAVLFAREGARVSLVDLSESRLSTVAQQCSALGKPPLCINADVTNELQAKNIMTKTIEHFGQIDILVNNAGIFKPARITDPDFILNFDANMGTNLRAVVLLTNLAAPHLIATKGNVVNVCSIASRMVKEDSATSYCVSKAGVEHFTRCAAFEMAAFGVRVNCVNPGPVKTNIFGSVLNASDERRKWDDFKQKTALGRLGEPEDIAYVINFLACDKAKSVTGSGYDSDNGFLLKGK